MGRRSPGATGGIGRGGLHPTRILREPAWGRILSRHRPRSGPVPARHAVVCHARLVNSPRSLASGTYQQLLGIADKQWSHEQRHYRGNSSAVTLTLPPTGRGAGRSPGRALAKASADWVG
jgi:hypothetical protein